MRVLGFWWPLTASVGLKSTADRVITVAMRGAVFTAIKRIDVCWFYP